MQSRYLEKIFIASIDSLEPIQTWLRSHYEEMGFTLSAWSKVEVALEEALINIINHAYAEKSGWIFFSCSVVPNEKVEFVIKDRGKPFNPEKKKLPNQKKIKLENCKIGGLGILLIHRNMDEVHYERSDPYNILTLVKRCTSLQ